MDYYFSKKVNLSFEQAVEQVTEALKTEGFGVLTQIDIHEKLKEKLNVDFRKYKILGACNPPYAYEALKSERMIGLMLPCNVVVQEADNGQTEVSAIDPLASMQAIDNPKLKEIAEQIRSKLETVINRM